MQADPLAHVPAAEVDAAAARTLAAVGILVSGFALATLTADVTVVRPWVVTGQPLGTHTAPTLLATAILGLGFLACLAGSVLAFVRPPAAIPTLLTGAVIEGVIWFAWFPSWSPDDASRWVPAVLFVLPPAITAALVAFSVRRTTETGH